MGSFSHERGNAWCKPATSAELFQCTNFLIQSQFSKELLHAPANDLDPYIPTNSLNLCTFLAPVISGTTHNL